LEAVVGIPRNAEWRMSNAEASLNLDPRLLRQQSLRALVCGSAELQRLAKDGVKMPPKVKRISQ